MANTRPVQRMEADSLWLLLVVSFGLSVAITRLFLQATGYPQVGGATLHIAHLLWGGLLLFLALAVVLILGNRWAYRVAAIMGGVGMGLFIDEVGKFITRDNDYFFPYAAPIIYGFLLLTVFGWLYLRNRRPRSARSQLYWALDQLKEVVDGDFEPEEFEAVQQTLREVLASGDMAPGQRDLAVALLRAADAAPTIPPPPPTALQRAAHSMRAAEEKHIGPRTLKSALTLYFLAAGFLSGIALLLVLASLLDMKARYAFLQELDHLDLVEPIAGVDWIAAFTLMAILVGLIYLVAGVLLFLGRNRAGVNWGRAGLVFSLTVVNLLAYYFNQFAMISSTTLSVVVLLALERYRLRFLSESSVPVQA